MGVVGRGSRSSPCSLIRPAGACKRGSSYRGVTAQPAGLPDWGTRGTPEIDRDASHFGR